MTSRDALRAVTRAALDTTLVLALAPVCAACTRPLEAPSSGCVCARCWSSIRLLSPPLCRICGDALPSWRPIGLGDGTCVRCSQGSLALDVGRAAGGYEGALRDIIHAFKYEGRRTLAAPLGRLMRAAGADILDGVHCAVPVPLHPWRRFWRGFNQAADLAATTGLPVVHALWRRRATRPQTGLTATARRRNVRRAFCLTPFRSRRALHHLLDGRIVLLIDDVQTTGATLNSCARVLKAAGVREVRALTVARAARRDGNSQ